MIYTEVKYYESNELKDKFEFELYLVQLYCNFD